MRKILVSLLALLSLATVSAKKTYTFMAENPDAHKLYTKKANWDQKPKALKAPNVKKYDSRNCAFDDSLNYMCLESSIDLKAGWEIKQKWQVASDINPAAVTQYTGTSPAAAFTYQAPDTELNVGYKYRWRFQPYAVFFFNARPNFKIDRLFMSEMQFNIDQFKSLFYFDIVYYQKAIQYRYSTLPGKPASQPDPTAYTATVGADRTTITSATASNKISYSFLGFNYPGKICIDIGYNTEDILMTLKAAVNWKDCYKNVLYTLFDYQNWFGPKAMWIDFCDFHTDEDFLIFASNPGGISKDTGD